MPNVTLIFSDGERRSFAAPSDKPILAAARSAGLSLASDCEIGDCQTCKANLRSGKVELDELAFVTLDDDEIASGAVLTCVSMAQDDVEIELPYLRGQLIPEKKYAMQVSGVELLSASTARLTGTLPRNSTFTFHPGQYVNIAVPGSGAVRSYSMASDPAQPSSLEFHIRLLPDGVMSNFVRRSDLAGASVEIVGPKGVFYLRDGDDPVVMVAGGTGLAPMMAMLKTLAGSDRANLPIVLCFGVSRPCDLYGIEELRALAKRLPNADLRMAMVEPEGAWPGHKGFVTGLLGQADVGTRTRAYLCGPPPMIASARRQLRDFGVPEPSIYAEEFVSSGTAEV